MQEIDTNQVNDVENQLNDTSSLYTDRTISGQYEKNESVEALARRERKKARQKRRAQMLRRVAQLAGHADYYDQLASLRQLGGKAALKTTFKNVAQRMLLKRMAIWLYAVSIKICMWQFVFGAIAAVGFAMHALVAGWQEGSTLGKIVGFFVDVQKYFPGQYIGYGFWALALIVGLCGFIGFMIFFYLLQIDLMRTTLTTFVLAVCLALTILPFTNIFPWLLFWVWYVVRTETSILGMAKDAVTQKRETAHGAPLTPIA